MKHYGNARGGALSSAFSILERIDVGETWHYACLCRFSCCRLSVSSNGSTWVKHDLVPDRQIVIQVPFSILERIDVGETSSAASRSPPRGRLSVSSNGSTWVKPGQPCSKTYSSGHLSVSSNGSTWVKLILSHEYSGAATAFQYPRTDRRG